jgi:tryptophan-rich sensory protein
MSTRLPPESRDAGRSGLLQQRTWSTRESRIALTLLVLGFLITPGEWYGQLAKPAFNPPGWIFGPVWTLLYVIVAVAGWRVWQRDRGGWPMKLWWAQLVMNFLWTPVFFGAHQISLAFVVILLMLAAILAFIATAWRQDRVAASLFAPYAAWVAFASVLNASLFELN